MADAQNAYGQQNLIAQKRAQRQQISDSIGNKSTVDIDSIVSGLFQIKRNRLPEDSGIMDFYNKSLKDFKNLRSNAAQSWYIATTFRSMTGGDWAGIGLQILGAISQQKAAEEEQRKLEEQQRKSELLINSDTLINVGILKIKRYDKLQV